MSNTFHDYVVLQDCLFEGMRYRSTLHNITAPKVLDDPSMFGYWNGPRDSVASMVTMLVDAVCPAFVDPYEDIDTDGYIAWGRDCAVAFADRITDTDHAEARAWTEHYPALSEHVDLIALAVAYDDCHLMEPERAEQ